MPDRSGSAAAYARLPIEELRAASTGSARSPRASHPASWWSDRARRSPRPWARWCAALRARPAPGSPPRACARSALAEIARLPETAFDDRPPPPADGAPVTGVTPMLATASAALFAGPQTAELPNEPVDARLLRGITAIEQVGTGDTASAAGTAGAAARSTARSILAERDAVLAAIKRVEPPPMTVEVFQEHLAAIRRELGELCATAHRKRAA